MVLDRRDALALGASVGSALLAGCSGDDEPALVYGFYLVNETNQPVTVAVEARRSGGGTIYEEQREVPSGDAESVGEFGTEPAEVHVVVEYSLHGDEPNELTASYRPPEEECSRRVANKVVVYEDTLEYGVMCNDYR